MRWTYIAGMNTQHTALALRAIILAAVVCTASVMTANDKTTAAPVVNINTATAIELAYLPGVGPAIAGRIISGRPYADREALDNVKGIGPVKLAHILPYVTVTGPTTAKAKIRTIK
jgi:DNA uptake protein ComE-like DNA-binding protein